MQLGFLLKEVRVTIFMKSPRTGVAKTEIFCIHPSTFEKAVNMALNAKFDFKVARYGIQQHNLSSFDKAGL